MQFAIICPASGLQRWATKSTCHLVLSHITNPVYQQFYRQRSEKGDLVILDNGAYEGKLNENQLLERIGLYHPKVVILPDILGGDAQESFLLAKQFHNVWKSRLPIQWMYVPQGRPGQVDKFFDTLDRGVNSLQPEWVGIPRIFGTDISPGLTTRAGVVRWIRDRYPDVNIHCLGMLAGDVRELPILEEVGCTSIDSSAPVWRGWNGYDIEDPVWREKGTDVDFDAYPIERNVEKSIIQHNLEKCGVKFNDGI